MFGSCSAHGASHLIRRLRVGHLDVNSRRIPGALVANNDHLTAFADRSVKVDPIDRVVAHKIQPSLARIGITFELNSAS